MEKTELLQMMIDEYNEYAKASSFFWAAYNQDSGRINDNKQWAIRDLINKVFGHDAYEYRHEKCTIFHVAFEWNKMEVRKDGVEV